MFKTKVECRIFAALVFLLEDFYLGIVCKFLCRFKCIIGRAVVDYNDRELVFWVLHLKERIYRGCECVAFVPARNQNSHAWVARRQGLCLLRGALFEEGDKKKNLEIDGQEQAHIDARSTNIHKDEYTVYWAV